MSKQMEKITHKEINNLIKENKDALGANRALLQTLRNSLHTYLTDHADDTKLTIYLDDIMDEPWELVSGKGRNELLVTVDGSTGDIKYEWLKERWTKRFADRLKTLKDGIVDILSTVFGKVGEKFTSASDYLMGTSKLAIEDK